MGHLYALNTISYDRIDLLCGILLYESEGSSGHILVLKICQIVVAGFLCLMNTLRVFEQMMT